jgi:hypothetical protein
MIPKDFIRNNVVILLLLAMVIMCGTALMLVSQEVYKTERMVTILERENQILDWEIRSLNGELAYLTRPDRMDQLSSAMGNDTHNSLAQKTIVMTPVDFSKLAPSHTITPVHKPNIKKPPSARTANRTAQTAPPKQTPRQQSFSSLLDTIGGAQ